MHDEARISARGRFSIRLAACMDMAVFPNSLKCAKCDSVSDSANWPYFTRVLYAVTAAQKFTGNLSTSVSAYAVTIARNFDQYPVFRSFYAVTSVLLIELTTLQRSETCHISQSRWSRHIYRSEYRSRSVTRLRYQLRTIEPTDRGRRRRWCLPISIWPCY